MISKTAAEWIEVLQDRYQDKMDEPLMLDWIDRHHAESSLGRVVSKRRFAQLIERTQDWIDDWPSTTTLHETIKEAAE